MEIDNWYGAEVVLCPSCGGGYLHHDAVRVSFRDDEDRPGTHVLVQRERVEARRSKEGFAGRRDDIAIRFSCENCDAKPVLRIVQHKGNTEIRWGNP